MPRVAPWAPKERFVSIEDESRRSSIGGSRHWGQKISSSDRLQVISFLLAPIPIRHNEETWAPGANTFSGQSKVPFPPYKKPISHFPRRIDATLVENQNPRNSSGPEGRINTWTNRSPANKTKIIDRETPCPNSNRSLRSHRSKDSPN